MESIFDILYVPMGYIIRFCYQITHNYAIALLLFALIIKIVLLPLGIKQQKGMIKQAGLRPKEMAIRKKYAGRDDKPSQQKMQNEIMDLYQKENYNPMSGCLPLLIQFPILMALYQVINDPLRYICRFSKDIIAQIGDKIIELYNAAAFSTEGLSEGIVNALGKGASALSGIDKVNIMRHIGTESFSGILPEGFTASALPNFQIFGNFDLSQKPAVASWLILIPILAFATTFISMKLSRKLTYQPQQPEGNAGLSMKIMDFTMPAFTLWITFTVPAVIGLYWIYQNILSTLQQFILTKTMPYPVFTEEELKQAEREINGSSKNKKLKKIENGAKPKVRSLHHIDDEEYQKALAESLEEEKEAKAESASGGRKKNKKPPSIITPAPIKEDRRDTEDDSEAE